MATNASEISENEEEVEQTEEQKAAAESEAVEPSPYDPLARDMGWVPKDEYKGDPEAWKDAETFIRDGRDIQRDTQRQLKELRSTVETIAKTSGSIVEQEVHRRMDELGGRYSKLVEDGDAAGALEVAGEMHNLVTTSVPQRSGPSSESQAFADRNKWFKVSPTAPGDALATATAIDVCNRLAGQGYDSATQLDAAEKEVRRQFPHLFGQNGKRQAGVHDPSSRGASLKSSGPKGYADLPDAARNVCNEMAARPELTRGDPEAFKKGYAENYWRNLEGKA